MAQVLHSSPHFSSPSSFCTDPPGEGIMIISDQDTPSPSPSSLDVEGYSPATECDETEGLKERETRRTEQLSALTILVALFRKSLFACNGGMTMSDEIPSMQIGGPSNVRHVSHVTFDRFNGFLGLPLEFEPEVPRRPPSAR